MAGDPVDPPDRPKLRAVSDGDVTEVSTFDPAYEAHRLRLTGMNWREVAKLTGYGSEASAKVAVTAYIQRAAMLQSEEQARVALATELERMDALTESWWGEGQRDEKAANVLLRISAQRTRLYEMLFASKEATSSPRTIVITGDSEDYIAGLRAIVEGDSHPDLP